MKSGSARGFCVGSCLVWVVACGSSESEPATSAQSGAGRASDATAGRVASEAGRGGTTALPGAGGAGAIGDAGTSTLGGTAGTSSLGGRSGAGGAAAGKTSAGAGGGATSGAAGSAGTCSDAPLTVLFVVDTSSSMNEALPTTRTTKWEITAPAVASAIDALPDRVGVGMMFFPNVPQGRMPCFNGVLAVPFAPIGDEQRTACFDALSRTQPTGATPTLDAYAYAEQQVATWAGAGPTAIVLVTDGVPDYGLGCTGDGVSTEPADWAPLQAMVESAARAGIYTLAVAAPDSAETHEMLTALANAGQPPGLCARNTTPGCFFDLDVSLELGAWLADSLPLAGTCRP